jgi:hypothetical protein
MFALDAWVLPTEENVYEENVYESRHMSQRFFGLKKRLACISRHVKKSGDTTAVKGKSFLNMLRWRVVGKGTRIPVSIRERRGECRGK